VPKCAILKSLKGLSIGLGRYADSGPDSDLFDLLWQWHEDLGSSPNRIHDFLEGILLHCSERGTTALLKHVVESTTKRPPALPLCYEKCIVAAFRGSKELMNIEFLSFLIDDLGLKVSAQMFNI